MFHPFLRLYTYYGLTVILFAAATNATAETEMGGVGPIIGITSETEFGPYRGITSDTDLLPFILYQNGDFYIEGIDFGYRFLGSEVINLSAHMHINTDGYEPDESGFFTGMQEPDTAWEAGIAMTAEFDDLELALLVLSDVSDTHGGQLASLSLIYEMELGAGWTLEPAITLTHHNSDYNQYYFGVTADEALPNRSAYTPDNSVNTSISLELQYNTGSSWFWLLELAWVSYDNVVANSPLLEDDTATSLELSVGYHY